MYVPQAVSITAVTIEHTPGEDSLETLHNIINKFYKAHPKPAHTHTHTHMHTHTHTHTHTCTHARMLALSLTQGTSTSTHTYIICTYIHTSHVWLTNLSQSQPASVALVTLHINKYKLWYISVFCVVRPPNHTDHTGEY